MPEFHSWSCSHDLFFQLVSRSQLLPSLIRRQQEEYISSLVPVNSDLLSKKRQEWLSGRELSEALSSVQWTESDLDLHLHLPDALQRFAQQRFGPGLEETFLSSKGSRDLIIYSLIRHHDPDFIRELWIRIEEGEISFSDAAANFGEGPEKVKNGLIGPVEIGTLQPVELQTLLRCLTVGQISAPTPLGQWHILLSVVQLQPAQFNDHTRKLLLEQQLNDFLSERVNRCISGQPVEPLQFYSDS